MIEIFVRMSSTEEVFKLLILYGSETGNSEDLAKRIAQQAIRQSISVWVKACDDYNVSQLIYEQMVLFICSTTGIGEEPNNMKKFWKFIRRKDLPNDSLTSVRIAVIGMGDSSYQKYNFVAKKLYKRLLELGAIGLTQLVLGDDQHDCGPNATIDPWLINFWDQLKRVFHIPHNLLTLKDTNELLSPSFKVQFVDENYSPLSNDFSNELNENLLPFYHKNNPYLARVLSNERVTRTEHFQDVRLIKLEIGDESSLKYGLGDVCLVKPQNSAQNVEQFLSLLKLDRNQNFILTKGEHNWMSGDSYYNNLPNPCSVLTLVTHYLDIQSIPKRSFFELFWRFSQNDLEKQKLQEFASTTSQEDLYEYCNRPKRNILEVLSDFPNTTPHIKFEYLFDLIPAINPRPFSIASSLNANPNELHLLVAVVNYRTRMKKPRLGLCSNWLANQTVESAAKVPIYLRKGTFKLPSDSTPIIMIGPGTGVAPFRGFIQDRALRKVSNNFLFFGCRYRNSDFYLEEEWKQINRSGHLEYFVAFSRDKDNEKVYVQHILWNERKLVWNLIYNNKASIYVAGNAKQMPTQVRQTIVDIFKQESNNAFDYKKIEQIVDNLELSGRLQFECWS